MLGLTKLFAQDTTIFNGKKYYVYPQEIIDEEGINKKLNINLFSLSLINNEIPPVIGNHKDGDYILKKKIYYSYYQFIDTIEFVYATFTIKNNQKNGVVNIYSYSKVIKPIISIPYKDDVIDGEVNGTFYIENRNFYIFQNIYGYLELANQKSEYPMTFPNKFKKVKCKLFFSKGILEGPQSISLI